jgi:hypothetical protein
LAEALANGIGRGKVGDPLPASVAVVVVHDIAAAPVTGDPAAITGESDEMQMVAHESDC